jgi:hypothetical protein
MRLTIFLAAAAFALPAAAADNVFDANYRQARENVATAAGAAYDRALSEAMERSTTVQPAMAACLDAHADTRGDLHGYFQFAAGGNYQVILRPNGAFADCVESALEGQSLPAPPKLPWYNQFVFTWGEAP